MQGSLWKSIALVGVICIGGLATREVHQRLQARNAVIPQADADRLAADILAAGEQSVDADLSDSQFDELFMADVDAPADLTFDPAEAMENALLTIDPPAAEPVNTEVRTTGIEQGGNPFADAAAFTMTTDSSAAVEPVTFEPEPQPAARAFISSNVAAGQQEPPTEAFPTFDLEAAPSVSTPQSAGPEVTLKTPPAEAVEAPQFAALADVPASQDDSAFFQPEEGVQPAGFADDGNQPFQDEAIPAEPVADNFVPFDSEAPVKPSVGFDPFPSATPDTAAQPDAAPSGVQPFTEDFNFNPQPQPIQPEPTLDSLPQPGFENPADPGFEGLPIVEDMPSGDVPMLNFDAPSSDRGNPPLPVPDQTFELPAHPLADPAPNRFEPFPRLPEQNTGRSTDPFPEDISDARSNPASVRDQPATEQSREFQPEAIPLRPRPESFEPLPPQGIAQERNFSPEPRTFDNGPVIAPRRSPSGESPGRRPRPLSNEIGDSRSTDRGENVRQVSTVMRPNMVLRKDAPQNATVDIPLDYRIFVRNDGDAPAYDVVVEDEVPAGAHVEGANPAAQRDRQTNRLIWNFDEVQPGETREIIVRITPTGEGTLDGVATVNFKSRVKATTVITAPKLQLQMVGQDEVRLGEEVTYRYVVTNTGTGEARNVYVRTLLPPEGGLKHPAGRDLEYEIASLKPAEQREIVLSVVAAEPGEYRAQAEVTAAGNVADQASWRTNIVGAQLKIDRRGPKRRFVGRSAVYENIISNETNFEAVDARVAERIPDGMRFMSAGKGGRYNAETRTVTWQINRLGPGKVETLRVELIPTEAGPRESVVTVFENAGIQSEDYVSTTQVEDLHNVSADISQLDGPVAVGETFGFTISIDNRGTADATDVELFVDVPEEIQVIGAGSREVPAKLRPGNKVEYKLVVRIGPGEKKDFEIKLRGTQPIRNGLVKANVQYRQMSEPLVIAESVTVYRDDL